MWRFGLRTRTAASYVLVTAAAVLIVEAVLVGFVISSAGDSTLLAKLQQLAGEDAKIMSASATKIVTSGAGFTAPGLLKKAMTASFGPAGPDRHGKEVPGLPKTTAATGKVAVEARRKADHDLVEALLDPAGRVIDSTAPKSFPPGLLLLADPSPRAEGQGGSGKTPAGTAAWWTSPILAPQTAGTTLAGDPRAPATRSPAGPSKGEGFQIIGYMYVQAPGDGHARVPFMDAAAPLLAPGALVLALVVPVGVVFGMLTTRPMIRRITRLAEATTAVAGGDFAPRVAVTGQDEVSRLEDGFNRMSEQLGAAVEAERLSARAEARQAERSRIARELHDSISQDLFSLSLLAAGMRRAAPETLRGQAEAMERTAARTMREMRALLLELRPVALEDAGLAPALEELCRAYETRLGIRVRTSLADVSLPAPAEHVVLRVTQEALGNAVKHASPREVEVELWRQGDEVRVRVADDGQGFDPSHPPPSHGMGLRLMRERVEELGGRFSLSSGRGKGTVVTAALPAGAEVPAAEPRPARFADPVEAS
ncbi:hypothetical protein Skr01_51460 [Sphaerisporangium krabiense]|uniref:Oxygen sensor histidine kinase NreB n=1 Tax=Sphaerisporangium krabiense TaxID=763782 RepID=A0A7W9DT00_9ACTN|nr:sensor histidine kinase [Sphaerisporangium krabiense]MBB5630113.1 signal transduction histidine kinase [Sphaerisporangium krabiense]GII65061.1 hypothetical protein Skr01_51460 [Sphaerisporangium krabiense]